MPTRLSSFTRQRQREAIRRTERVADQAERAVHLWWRDLLAIVKAGPQLGVTRLYTMALRHYQRLPGLVRGELRDGLMGLYQWGVASAQRGIPRAVLRRAYGRRLQGNQRLAEGDSGSNGLATAGRTLARLRGGMESRVPVRSYRGPIVIRGPGSVPGDKLSVAFRLLEDRAADILRDFLFSSGLTGGFPALPEDIPDDLLRSLVLPTPPLDVIQQRVDRLIAPFLSSPRPDLVDPQRFAAQLVQSYSQGKTLQQIAADLLPTADGVRASARRVARTWGTAIAQDSQMEAHESLGPDLVIGYRIHSAKRMSSRQWHVDRDGQEYFRNPKPGQKSFFQLPHPPREAADVSERPAGTPWLAHN